MLSNLNDAEGPTTLACDEALVTRVGDFVGLAVGGTGDVALEPTLLPQSVGTALRGVLPPELESFKLAQLLLPLFAGA